MHIDKILRLATESEGETMSLPEDWSQGRTAFGGVSAALLYAAMQKQVGRERRLRSLTTNFVGPLIADIPFSVEVELLRQGKNATQAAARIIQEEQVVVAQLACFGEERSSHIVVENRDSHSLPAPPELERIPVVPGVSPAFFQHIDFVVAKGSMPYSDSSLSCLHGWMRFREPPAEISDAHLICLIDAWPPAVIQMMEKPAPASSMTWNLEFIHPHAPVAPDEWFAYQAETRQAAGGYAHSEANIWDSAGELVAISRQSIAVFD